MGRNSHDKKAIGTDQQDESSNDGGGENLSHGSPRELERTLSENTSGKSLPVAEQISALYRSRVIFAGLMVLVITAAGTTSHFMTHQTQQSMLDERVCDVGWGIGKSGLNQPNVTHSRISYFSLMMSPKGFWIVLISSSTMHWRHLQPWQSPWWVSQEMPVGHFTLKATSKLLVKVSCKHQARILSRGVQ